MRSSVEDYIFRVSIWEISDATSSHLQVLEYITIFFFSSQSPSSTTPPIEINSSRLTKLMRRSTDKKSEFLKALKDDRNGEMPERHENNKLEDVSEQFICI